jgi:signal transduction histidine kinase
MLKHLRWQLTLLYLIAAMSLVALVGGGAYWLIRHYFQATTDLALQYKMAGEFRRYGISLPTELANAEQTWLANNASQPTGLPALVLEAIATPSAVLSPAASPTTAIPTQAPTTLIPRSSSGTGSEGESEDGEGGGQKQVIVPRQTPTQPTAVASGAETEASDQSFEDSYDARLAPIFVIPLTAKGDPVSGSQGFTAPMIQSEEARSVALATGWDLRTVTLPDGNRMRLITYRTNGVNAPALLQAGRFLADQDRVLSQLLTGLLLLGGLISILIAAASWWLAGRSLGPAQRAWDQQQAFISNASHELRTPLTLIRATAEYGLRNKPGEQQKEVLEGVLDESDYMNRLVDDLLLLSRLDTRRLQLKHEVIPLAGLLDETRRSVEKLMAEKNIELVVKQSGGAVWGDPTRVREVLLILLDNALRFTPPGGIIYLEALPLAKVWQIIVADTGRGIPPEHLPHLFERFYSVNPPGEVDMRSNGLGLSIAKGLIEAQGGSIHLQSQVGRGTQATIVLPRADVDH